MGVGGVQRGIGASGMIAFLATQERQGLGDMAKHLLSSKNREFRSLLDKCATADHLTIFVGAGCSTEVGLPTWDHLIDRYLGVAIELKLQDNGPDVADFRRRKKVIRELRGTFKDAMRAAVIGDMLLGDKRRRSALRLALYNQLGDLRPGPSVLAIALIYRERMKKGLVTTLVTTNYDDLMERALIEVGFKQKAVKPRTIQSIPRDTDIADVILSKKRHKRILSGKRVYVWHLHGYMPFRDEQVMMEPIIFSERDYSVYNLGAVDAIASLFDIGSCLFTGMSLVDFDIATAAYSATHLASETLDMARPSDADHFAITIDRSSARSVVGRLGAARLDSMGIHRLSGTSTYGQIPQVAHELALRVRDGKKYWDSDFRYGKRLENWAEEHTNHYEQQYHKKSFFHMQVELAKLLANDLRKLERKSGISSIGDTLGLHIWRRDAASHRLDLWISTEYAKRSPQSPGSTDAISMSSRFCAVRTAAYGVPSSQFEELGPGQSSRWMQSLGVPVITHPASTHGRLLVGVVTLSSNLSSDESELSQMLVSDSSLVSTIEKRLLKIGTKYLVK